MLRTSISGDSCSIHCDQPSHWQQTSTFFQFRIFAFPKLHQIHLTFGLKETAPISFCLLKLGFLLFRFLLELVFSLFYNPVPYPIPSVWPSIFLCSSSRHFRSDFLHSVQLAEISVPAALPNKTLSSFGLVLFHVYRTCGVYGKTCTANEGTGG